MSKNSYNVLAVMSGTSLDGIDLAYIYFELKSEWSFQLKIVETIQYPSYWLEKLTNLANKKREELISIDKEYTYYLAKQINVFIGKNKIQDINFISSHGHTALHQPDKGITYQIGNREELAQLTNKKVVCDFRVQDVNLGGQGAPLVPIGDMLLFNKFDYCLNLGGFANISLEKNSSRIAYDICPVNIVLNYYARLLGHEFDYCGTFAREGEVNTEILKHLNKIQYYYEKPPKSLGVEWVNKMIFPILSQAKENPKNILRTYCEHIAIQISNAINKKPNVQVLVTGGGAYNTFLIQRIKEISNTDIVIPKKELIEFKEALIFGLLGVLKIRDEVNCLSSVTGANNNHSSGVIFEPKKKIIST